MNESINSKQEKQLQETLDLLEQMQVEIEQKDQQIVELQQQQNELLNLNEKLASENKIENVQALKNDLRQAETLLKEEKLKLAKIEAETTDAQDKLEQEKQARQIAETNQKIIEVPVEKPVLYERCGRCDRKLYRDKKELYDKKRDKLEAIYKSKTAIVWMLLIGFVLYSLMVTVFEIIKSGAFMDDVREVVSVAGVGIKYVVDLVGFIADYVGNWSNVISNEGIAGIVYWLLYGIVIIGVIVGMGFIIIKDSRKVIEVYKTCCMDWITVMVLVVSLAVMLWFGDWIQSLWDVNVVVVIVLVQMVYLGIRLYVKGWKEVRGR